MTLTKVEERLQQTLVAKARPDELIDVVLRFEMPPASGTRSGSPQTLKQRREDLAQVMSGKIASALARAGEMTGESPAQVSMFPSLGSVMVQAHRPYLQALLEQAEVSGAMLNSDPGSR
jgi:hypothetical protein